MLRRASFLVLLVSLLSAAVYAAEYVDGEAIVSYSRNDGQEKYIPSDPSEKAAERTAFCDCVRAIRYPINPNYEIFGSCTPIHPVLPNLPQSFISNHLLNEVVIHIADQNVNFSNLSSKFDDLALCTDTFSIEYSVPNYIYETDLPNAGDGSGDDGRTTAGADPSGPTDHYFGEQWALRNQTTPDADINWSVGIGETAGSGGEIIVAVIDTGVDYSHPDFTRQDLTSSIWTNPDEIPNNIVDDDGNGKIDDVHGFDFKNSVDANRDGDYLDEDDVNDPDPMDEYGHGTEMAGVIAAAMNNNIDPVTQKAKGIAGVCPNCKIMALRVAQGGSGNEGFTDSRVRAAVGYATLKGADVINMSFFDLTSCVDNPNQTPCNSNDFARAVPELLSAYREGVVLVACAGNYYSSPVLRPLATLAYPAAFGYVTSANEGFDVIGVAATDNANARAQEFNCIPGDNTNCTTKFGGWVDVSAPGKNILSTVPASFQNPVYGAGTNERYARSSGSSFSTAHVSGVAALIISKNPNWRDSTLNISSRCGDDPDGDGPELPSEPCFHDYVREIIKTTANANAIAGIFNIYDDPNIDDGTSDFGAGLLDAEAAVMGAVPDRSPRWVGVHSDGFGAGTPEDPVRLHSNKETRFEVMFNDLDGDPLTVTMQAAPGLQHAIFDGTIFSWTASAADMLNPSAMVGYYDLRFTADDGRGGVVQGPLVTIAIPTNRAPYFLSDLPANIEVHLGDWVDITLEADDPDKDPVTFHPGYICNAIVNPGDPISCFTTSLPANSTFTDVPSRSTYKKRFTWRPVETNTCVDGSCPLNMLSFYASDRGPVVFDANGYLVDDPLINPAARLTDGDGTLIQVTATNEAPLIDPGLPSAVVVNGTTQLNGTASDPHNDLIQLTSSNLPAGISFIQSGNNAFTLTWTFPQPMDSTVTFTATDYFVSEAGQEYLGMSSQKSVTLDFDTKRPYTSVSSPGSCVTNTKAPFNAAVYDDRGLSSYTLKLYRGVLSISGAWTFPEPPLDTKSGPLSGVGPAYAGLTPSADLSYIKHRYTYQFKDAQSNILSGYRDFTVKTICTTSGGGGGSGGGGSGDKDSGGPAELANNTLPSA